MKKKPDTTANLTLPTFFIIGAAKSGTTTLHTELIKHPDIFLSANKEPMFFSSDEKYGKGMRWYSNNFFKNAGQHSELGEATPHYLYWAEKVAPRISEHFKADQVRFIVILRNPVERAYSWYWNMVREGNEKLDFEQAIEQEPSRLLEHENKLRRRGSMVFGYLKGGMYARQLENFFDYFPREKFLILLHDDLLENYNQTFDKVFAFLDLIGPKHLMNKKSNLASLPKSRRVQEFISNPSGILYDMARPFTHRLTPRMRYYLKKTIRKKNLKAFNYPPIKRETAKKLDKFFRPEIENLEKLIQRDLLAWHLD